MDVSPLFKILLVFATMLVLIRAKLPMGIAMVLGGIALGLWAGRGWAVTMGDMGYALRQPELWLLAVIMALIFEYGRYMADARNAQVIMNAARAWGGRHGRMAGLMAIPAVIGLIPMPGGAMFSAPLVNQVAHGETFDNGWKSAVNYWFRHVWEYWWPVYPVVIVTLSIFDMELGWFILMQLPLSAAALVGGYFILIRPHRAQLALPGAGDEVESNVKGQRIFWPLWGVIIATLALPPVMAWLWPDLTLSVRRLLAMLLGLAVGLIWILRDSGPEAHGQFLRHLMAPKALSLIATVAGVMIFKDMLDRSSLLPLAGEQLIASGIPLILVVVALPFLAGLVTGIAIGFAGIAFPLLAGLAAATETGLAPASTLVLGFAFGYAGMMCSPIHLCFILSRGYFSAPLKVMYRYIITCSLFPLSTAVFVYVLMRLAGR